MRIGCAEYQDEDRVVLQSDGVIAVAPSEVSMRELIGDWAAWRPRLDAIVQDGASPRLSAEEVTWRPPVMPDKLICVGTNYRDHIAEMEANGGPTAPTNPWPFAFLKPPRTALVGHRATVTLPGFAREVDWEVELALVIGDGSRASGPEPLEAVFGYSVFNDLSVRDHRPPPHALGLDAVVAKGFDGSAPMGPWIVTADEIDDPQDLGLRLSVNDALKQDSSTSQMIFGLREMLRHFAEVLTLSPGDVIATGTPAGVGIARRPPETLQPGDVVVAEIEGIGSLQTTFAAPPLGDRG